MISHYEENRNLLLFDGACGIIIKNDPFFEFPLEVNPIPNSLHYPMLVLFS